MLNDVFSLSRRRLLLLAGGLATRVYGYASDFWNQKAPADWSSDEVHELLNKSPWAKPVTATVGHSSSNSGSNGGGSNNGNMGNGGNGGNGGNSTRGLGGSGGGMGGGSRGMGGMGSGGSGMGGGGGTPHAAQQFKGIVRWESAKPVQEAAKTALGDQFSAHYVICVIGFPLGHSSEGEQPHVSKSALEKIKTASTLTPKGKDAVTADAALVVGDAVLLGFAQDALKLSPGDKEVAFATLIGRMAIKTKFTFKEMMYHESLAI